VRARGLDLPGRASRHAPARPSLSLSQAGECLCKHQHGDRSSNRRSAPVRLGRHAGARVAVLVVSGLGTDSKAGRAACFATGAAGRRPNRTAADRPATGRTVSATLMAEVLRTTADLMEALEAAAPLAGETQREMAACVPGQ
jgi:hypothetical protein